LKADSRPRQYAISSAASAAESPSGSESDPDGCTTASTDWPISGSGSPIATLRASSAASKVSSVDDADFVAGQSAVIQALAVQLNGGNPGSYGIANGASAVAPSPAPTASVSASASATTSVTKKKTKK